jgi:hypothetical protein
MNLKAQESIEFGYGAYTLLTPDRNFEALAYKQEQVYGSSLVMPNYMHGLVVGGALEATNNVYFELRYCRKFSQSSVFNYKNTEGEFEERWRRRINTITLGAFFGDKWQFGGSLDAGRQKFKVKTIQDGQEITQGYDKAYYLNHIVLGASINLIYNKKKFSYRLTCQFLEMQSFLSSKYPVNYNHPSSNIGMGITYRISK